MCPIVPIVIYTLSGNGSLRVVVQYKDKLNHALDRLTSFFLNDLIFKRYGMNMVSKRRNIARPNFNTTFFLHLIVLQQNPATLGIPT